MAKLRIKAIAPPIDPPIQWGSNIMIVQASYYMKDQSLNPQKNIPNTGNTINGVTHWQEYNPTIMDFTTDTLPPFIPNKGRDFKAVKVIGIENNIHISVSSSTISLNRHLLELNGVEVVNGTIISKEDLNNGKLSFISCAEASTTYKVIPMKVLFSDLEGHFSEETETIFTLLSVGKQVEHMQYYNFNQEAVLEISQQIVPLTANTINSVFNIQSSPNIGSTWSDLDMHNFYVNTVGSTGLHKVEFIDLEGCKAIEYFGKPIVKGQKIQIQAFQQGYVKVRKSMLDKPYNIEIAMGHAYTGKFRITPNII